MPNYKVGESKRLFVVDALSIRYGGGLVLLKNLLASFIENSVNVVILVNSQDELEDKLPVGANISIKVIENSGTALAAFSFRRFSLRRFLSKLRRPLVLISFNSFSSVGQKQVTLHINTVPFLPFTRRLSIVGVVRAVFSGRASRRALTASDLNIFESDYLFQLAESVSENKIRNGVVRYFGTDLIPKSYQNLRRYKSRANNLITITSGAPHKQNEKTIRAFQTLKKHYPDIELIIVGNEENIKNQIFKSCLLYTSPSPRD